MPTPRPLDRPMISRMARAICDADPTMEDVKWGRRCRTFGCVEGSNRCIAFKQAAAVARLFDAMILDRPQAAA
jgi:hypothetical protein